MIAPARLLVVVVASVAVAGSLALAPLHRAPVGKTHVVRMIDKSPTEFAYEPASVTASVGDVIQFVQTTATPHNVDFREAPNGADLGTAKTGEFMLAPEQKYELRIDERFRAGSYRFVCTPHELLGMKGTLTVVAAK